MDCHKKKCTNCQEIKPSKSGFRVNDDWCKPCRQKEDQEEAERIKTTGQKGCKTCEKRKPLCDFEALPTGYRNVCNDCTYQRKRTEEEMRKESNQKKVVSKGDCRQCNKVFNEAHPEEFHYRSNRGYYDAICMTCYKAKNYSQQSRQKRKAEDASSYLEQNSKRMREYRAAHTQEFKAYNKKRTNEDDERIKIYRRSANNKNVEFKEEDIDAFAEQFHLPCVYCGIRPEDKEGELNGLDRVDPRKGYVIENTLPCCFACNKSKGQISPFQFIHLCKMVAARYEEVDVDDVFDKFFSEEDLPRVKSTMLVNDIIIAKKNNANKRALLSGITPSGVKVSFYHKESGHIGKITNSTAEAGDIIGINTAHIKLNITPPVIWVEPCWMARRSIPGDEEHPEAVVQFNNDIKTGIRNNVRYFVRNEEDNAKVYFRNISDLATYLHVSAKLLQDLFKDLNHKEQNTSTAFNGRVIGSDLCA